MKPMPSQSTVPGFCEHDNGYLRFFDRGRCLVVCEWAAPAIRVALQFATLHEWAADQIPQEVMRGRGVNYSVLLPTNPPTAVVVRRNRHGGFLRVITREYFLKPTRAPLELATSVCLAAAGIPTPQVIAYAVYPTAGIFARSDVMTRRLPEGADLPEAWGKAGTSVREAILRELADLLERLEKAGAWHADLNVKNIYIAGTSTDLTAYLLDVDRVTFPETGDIATRNFNRLARSARKWRQRWEKV
jgi:3-deoxy-D-manno-octulosonic acid kinase